MSHTSEPWGVPADGNLLLADSDGNILITGGGDTDYGMIAYATLADDARRIVACVNACAGIPTETLDLVPNFESAGITTIREIEKKRDELLAALQGYVKNDEQSAFEDWLHITCPSGDVESVQRKWEESSLYSDFLARTEKARAAIAKAESAK